MTIASLPVKTAGRAFPKEEHTYAEIKHIHQSGTDRVKSHLGTGTGSYYKIDP